MKDFDTVWAEYSDLVRTIRKKPFSCRGELFRLAAIALRNEIRKHVKPDPHDMYSYAGNLLYRYSDTQLEMLVR
jgi:hypothetical protein